MGIGRFRWVELQLKFLYTAHTPSILEKRLGKLPPDLERSYQVLYDTQMQNLGADQSKVVQRILSWLLVAKRPLTTAEMCELVCAPEEPDMGKETVLHLCFDLVTSDTQFDVFRFAHLSVREFLEKRNEYKQVYTHGMATNACLQLMTKRKRFSRSKYEAVYWAFHAEDAVKNGGGDIVKEGLNFFLLQESILATWSRRLKQSIMNVNLWTQTLAEERLLTCLRDTSINKNDTSLLVAACFGLLQQLEQLLSVISRSSDHGVSDWSRQYALSLSCRFSQAHVATVLLKHGVDINSRDGYGRSPLWWAAHEVDAEIIKLLLVREGVDINLGDIDGISPAFWIVKLLRARDDADTKVALLDGEDRSLLAQKGVNVNFQDTLHGRPLLSWAVRNGHTAVVELLLAQNDAAVDLRDIGSWSLLSLAAEYGHAANSQLLLARKSLDVNLRDTEYVRSLLSWAAKNDYTTIIKLLLAWDDVDVNSRDNNGRSLLSWAAKIDHPTIVELLLARDDVDVNLRDTEHSRSLLSWAAKNDYTTITKLLLARDDVDVNSRDNNGRSPLSWAAAEGRMNIVYLLLMQHDSDVSSGDDSDAESQEKLDIDARDNDGRSPLSWAAAEGRTDIVRLLLMHGVDIDARDNDGRSPLSWASINGHRRIVRLLRAATARTEKRRKLVLDSTT
jgi:ankyrin repeat protein